MEKLKLTEQGVEELTKMIEAKKQELRELGKYKASAAANEGDAWHDNFAFEQTEIKERALIRQISDLQEQVNNATIIKAEKHENKAGIKSKVKVLMKYSEGDTEEYTFTLDSTGNVKEDIVSINSPLGSCVFEKEEGFEGTYSVNGMVTNIKILSISN